MKTPGAEKAEQLLRTGLDRLGVSLTDRSIADLMRYGQELIKWNGKMNLVAKKTTLEEAVEIHFLDSLTLLPVLQAYAPAGNLLDVGAGAGFPGLVIKAACPDRSVTLLEPRLKRVSFLNHIIRLLRLEDVLALPHRTDDAEAFSAAPFAVITSRAVADVASFLDMVQNLATPETLVACMQGASGQEQWEEAKDNRVFDRVAIEQVRLPFSPAGRAILLFRKKGPGLL